MTRSSWKRHSTAVASELYLLRTKPRGSQNPFTLRAPLSRYDANYQTPEPETSHESNTNICGSFMTRAEASFANRENTTKLSCAASPYGVYKKYKKLIAP